MSKTKNGDLPINPSIGILSQQQEHGATQVGDGDTLQFHGLTKREYFAVMAMQGLIDTFNGEHSKELAKRSIQAADELLKQLDNEQ